MTGVTKYRVHRVDNLHSGEATAQCLSAWRWRPVPHTGYSLTHNHSTSLVDKHAEMVVWATSSAPPRKRDLRRVWMCIGHSGKGEGGEKSMDRKDETSRNESHTSDSWAVSRLCLKQPACGERRFM